MKILANRISEIAFLFVVWAALTLPGGTQTIAQTVIYGGQGVTHAPHGGSVPVDRLVVPGNSALQSLPGQHQAAVASPSGVLTSPSPMVTSPMQLPPTPMPVDPLSQQTQVNIPWYQNLAATRHHDFGVVPTASKQQHIFEFENTSGSDLVLAGVRASCGCTKPAILTNIVAPGQTAQVSAILDTLKFQGERGATLTVSVKRMGPVVEWGELQFSVKGKIRKDVVLNPGEVNFGTVLEGNSRELLVDLVYAGPSAWTITDVKSTNPNLKAVVRQPRRDDQARLTRYQLVVALAAEQDLGSFNEYLSVITNDPKTSGMPVCVQGRVRKGIEVAPVRLGTVFQHQQVSKRLIVKSDVPFSVQSIEAGQSNCKFRIPSGAKQLHIIEYDFDSSLVGKVSNELIFKTTHPDQPEIRVDFSANVVPPAIADN